MALAEGGEFLGRRGIRHRASSDPLCGGESLPLLVLELPLPLKRCRLSERALGASLGSRECLAAALHEAGCPLLSLGLLLGESASLRSELGSRGLGHGYSLSEDLEGAVAAVGRSVSQVVCVTDMDVIHQHVLHARVVENRPSGVEVGKVGHELLTIVRIGELFKDPGDTNSQGSWSVGSAHPEDRVPRVWRTAELWGHHIHGSGDGLPDAVVVELEETHSELVCLTRLLILVGSEIEDDKDENELRVPPEDFAGSARTSIRILDPPSVLIEGVVGASHPL